MPTHPILHRSHHVFALSLKLLSRFLPRLCKIHLFHFARILNGLMKFVGGNITKNILNDYILDEIETGTREENTRKIRIDVNRFCCGVKQVLTPSELIHKFHCT